MKQIVSFVIPVYQNSGSLKITYNKIIELFREPLSQYNYEFVFVNDGSNDSSLQELNELAELDKQVKIISFSRNFGQLPAIAAGMKYAKADAAIIMSADMQDPPELISEMINKWQSGSEVVICNRRERDDDWLSEATSNVFYSIMKKLIKNMPEGGVDFIFLSRKAIDQYNKIDERNRFLQGDILWLGFSVSFIPYQRVKRLEGKSQWTISKKVKYFIDGILNTSYLLIRAMSLTGLFVSIVGFLFSFVVIYARIKHQTPFPGYAPIVILLLIIGGFIMIMLGIIGEYIWRIYDETRKRPYYIIDKTVNI